MQERGGPDRQEEARLPAHSLPAAQTHSVLPGGTCGVVVAPTRPFKHLKGVHTFLRGDGSRCYGANERQSPAEFGCVSGSSSGVGIGGIGRIGRGENREQRAKERGECRESESVKQAIVFWVKKSEGGCR